MRRNDAWDWHDLQEVDYVGDKDDNWDEDDVGVEEDAWDECASQDKDEQVNWDDMTWWWWWISR